MSGCSGTPRTAARDGPSNWAARAVAYEAFARFPAAMRHHPARLFSDAAALGMAADLELAAVEAALRAARDLPTGSCLHVNVSPHAVSAQALIAVIADAGWDPTRIVIEVTDQTPVHDYRPLVAAAAELRRVGCRLAVDDFGAGYASYQHLIALSPEII